MPFAETFTGVVSVIVRVVWLHVGVTTSAVPLTVTLLAAIVAGIVVPLGKTREIVCDPAVSAPPEPVVKLTVYWAATLAVVGLGVTVAGQTLLEVIVYTFDSAEPLFVAATVSV